MNPEQFGALALQLLQASQVPGAALDQAILFRDLAAALAEGRATVVKRDKLDDRPPHQT